MKNIHITVKYFGAIAELTTCSTERIIVEENQGVEDLHQTLLEKYNPLKTATYKIAHNQRIIEDNHPLKDQDEIALLPPFAGG